MLELLAVHASSLCETANAYRHLRVTAYKYKDIYLYIYIYIYIYIYTHDTVHCDQLVSDSNNAQCIEIMN